MADNMETVIPDLGQPETEDASLWTDKDWEKTSSQP